MKQHIIDDLSKYSVNSIYGFLPPEDPLDKLPDLFKPLENIAANLNVLLMTGQLKLTLANLAVPNISYLENEQQIRRAFLILSVFGNAFIWSDHKPATKIPHTIAVPWCELATILDCPPIVSYGSIVLDNWRRLDKTKPIGLDNIATLQLFLGGLDEQWFYLIHIAIEAKGARAVIALVEAQKSILTGKYEAIVGHFQVIHQALTDMHEMFERISEKCDPYIFYHRVRRFMAGWQEPGVIYEGVSNEPQKFVGASAAQSPLIQSLDAGLGIEHSTARGCTFLVSMRSYMSPAHRKFIEALETGPSLRQFVMEQRFNYPVLCDSYNDCIQALEKFRKKHMQIATCYIARQANQIARGTGGTDFTNLLKEVQQETANHLISVGDQASALKT